MYAAIDRDLLDNRISISIMWNVNTKVPVSMTATLQSVHDCLFISQYTCTSTTTSVKQETMTAV